MRSFLFETTVRITYSSIWLIERAGAVVIFLPLWLTHFSKKVVANVGMFFIERLGDEQIKEAEEQAVLVEEAKAYNTELSLLTAATKVRDHAEQHGDWTDYHTEAINSLGDALLNTCDWEEEAVHQYLRGIVESIEGLEYHIPED